MDKIDFRLLAAMELNSRVSLKTLARDLNVKTSTIYHRLHKLKEENVIEFFSVVLNPELVGLKRTCIMTVRLKKVVVGKLDSMFLESFGKYLADTFEEVLFAGVGEDELIWLIAAFKNDAHIKSFLIKIKDNPYVDIITPIIMNKVLKGKKLYGFSTGAIESDRGEFFDDTALSEEPEKEEKDSKEDSEKEVFF